jgi:hypothetical protein
MSSLRQRLDDAPIVVWFLIGFIAFSVGEVATLFFVGLPPDPMILTAALVGGLGFGAVVIVAVSVLRTRRRGRTVGAAVTAAIRDRHLPQRIDQAGWASALWRRLLSTSVLVVLVPLALLLLAVPGVFIAQNADELRAGLYWAVTAVLVIVAVYCAVRLVRRAIAIRSLLDALSDRRERPARR